MTDSQRANQVLTDAVQEVSNGTVEPKEMSMEALALLINTERLKHLETKITDEFVELKKRQDKVSFLHKVIKTINAATVDGEFDCSTNEELKALLDKARESGIEIKEGKYKFNKGEREHLIENVRMTIDDHNTLNDMQLQTINRLTTERYESYQIARSIMKPLHDAKTNMARGMASK